MRGIGSAPVIVKPEGPHDDFLDPAATMSIMNIIGVVLSKDYFNYGRFYFG